MLEGPIRKNLNAIVEGYMIKFSKIDTLLMVYLEVEAKPRFPKKIQAQALLGLYCRTKLELNGDSLFFCMVF